MKVIIVVLFHTQIYNIKYIPQQFTAFAHKFKITHINNLCSLINFTYTFHFITSASMHPSRTQKLAHFTLCRMISNPTQHDAANDGRARLYSSQFTSVVYLNSYKYGQGILTFGTSMLNLICSYVSNCKEIFINSATTIPKL